MATDVSGDRTAAEGRHSRTVLMSLLILSCFRVVVHVETICGKELQRSCSGRS